MRIGLFGGSFDPVHMGHLLAAECCREQAQLDRVLFMPAAIPPHKQDRLLTPAHDRVAMLTLAIGGHDAFAIATDEIDRGGVSYTVETLERMQATHAGDTLVLILGPDAIRQFPTWREPARILELADLLVVERAGLDDGAALEHDAAVAATLGAERLARIIAARVRMPAVGIRAKDLRAAVVEGRSIRYRTPRAVETYIAMHGLYRETG